MVEPISRQWFSGQHEAVHNLRRMPSGAVLKGRVGSGKTLVTISHARDLWYLGRLSSLLIIVPSHLLQKWKEEIERWWPEAVGKVMLCNTTRIDYTLPTKGLMIVVTTYHYASVRAALFKDRVWDLRVCDEAHKLKNPSSRRTRAICGGFSPHRANHILAFRFLYLTATEIITGPQELWVMYRSLGALDMLYTRYREQYVLYDYNGSIAGVKNEEHLLTLIAPLRVDIPTDLSDDRLVLQSIPIETKKVKKGDLNFVNSFWSEEHGKVILPTGGDDSKNFARIIVEIGIAKVPFAIALYETLLEKGYTPIIFYLHLKVGIALRDALAEQSPPKLDSNMSIKDRAVVVADFQAGRYPKGLLCGIRAMGEGIELTKADAVIMVEVDYTPPKNRQALGRLDRHGQVAETIPVQILTLKGSLDDNVHAVLKQRQKIIDVLED